MNNWTLIFLLVVVGVIGFLILCLFGWIGKKKGYSFFAGFFLVLFFNWIGMIIVVLFPSRHSSVYDSMYASKKTFSRNNHYAPGQTAANVNGQSKADAQRFVVDNVFFNSYSDARTYCVDRKISVGKIKPVRE